MKILLDNFLESLGLQKPLIAIQGDIFETIANHIAFAVHWDNKGQKTETNNDGFAAKVAKNGWSDLCKIKFKKGEPQSKLINGKWFHALPIHTNEEGGWEEAPGLIKTCLDKLTIVSSVEVIATVLMGGGASGEKYKASVRNLEGMLGTHKTIVLYVNPNDNLYDLLVGTGVVAQPLPNGMNLLHLPKVIKYQDYKKLLEKQK